MTPSFPTFWALSTKWHSTVNGSQGQMTSTCCTAQQDLLERHFQVFSIYIYFFSPLETLSIAQKGHWVSWMTLRKQPAAKLKEIKTQTKQRAPKGCANRSKAHPTASSTIVPEGTLLISETSGLRKSSIPRFRPHLILEINTWKTLLCRACVTSNEHQVKHKPTAAWATDWCSTASYPEKPASYGPQSPMILPEPLQLHPMKHHPQDPLSDHTARVERSLLKWSGLASGALQACQHQRQLHYTTPRHMSHLVRPHSNHVDQDNSAKKLLATIDS